MAEHFVYIVFSCTPSGMGKLIRAVTRQSVNHVSVSLYADLHQMYSFARYIRKAPLAGGFIFESSLRYDQKDKKVPISVCRIPFSDQQYEVFSNKLNEFLADPDEYLYNSLDAAFYPLHIKVPIKNAYTCVDFAYLLLLKAGVLTDRDKDCQRFDKLKVRLAPFQIYEGDIKDFAAFEDWGKERYAQPLSFFQITRLTFNHFKKLFIRIFS